MYNIFAEWSGRSVLEKEVIGMAKREFRLKLIGTILILAFIAALCWLGIYAKKHSYQIGRASCRERVFRAV